MTGSLPRRYAKALIGIAREEGQIREYGDHIERFTALLEKTEALAALSNDLFDSAGRLHAVEKIAERVGSPLLLNNFLRLLVEKERIGLLPEIVREYRHFEDEALGVVRVRVQTPAAPDSSLLPRVERVLADRLRKKVLAQGEARPEILGGVILQVGHTIYDGSIRRELERLREEIL